MALVRRPGFMLTLVVFNISEVRSLLPLLWPMGLDPGLGGSTTSASRATAHMQLKLKLPVAFAHEGKWPTRQAPDPTPYERQQQQGAAHFTVCAVV